MIPRSPVLAAVAATLAVVMISGCSSHTVMDPPQNPSSPLTIWVRQAPDSAAAATAGKLVRAFQAHTGIKAKLVTILDDFETKLQQQAGQRQLPDIVINDTAQLGNMQRQGWIREVRRSTFVGAEQISDQAWRATKASNGRYYAVPFSAHAFAVFVRRDWRLKLGLPEPKTWNDIADLAEAFTKRDPDGDGKADTFGMVIPGTTKRGYMSWYFSSYLWANGGDFLLPVAGGRWRPAINQPPAVQAASWLKGLACEEKVVNPDAVSIDTSRAHDTFEKGIGGVYLTGPYMLPRFVKSMGSNKLEVFPLPKGPSGGPGALAEGENVYLMSGSANHEGQRRFAEFASSVAGQTIAMDGDNPGPIVRLPVNKAISLGTVRSDTRWQTFQDVYDRAGVYTPNVPNWASFRQMSAETLNAILADCGSNVQQAMDRLAAQFAAELRRQKVYAA